MATKSSTIYSDNPKMDRSGITAERPKYGYMGTQLGTEKVTGGKLYMEGIREEEAASKRLALTSNANLRKAAGYVNQGLSCDHAMDVLARETLHMPDRVDVIKATAKMFGGSKKG
jgi:hypothetical protein